MQKGRDKNLFPKILSRTEIISASQKELIDILDDLVEQMIIAAQKKDFLLVEQSLKNIYSYRK